MFVFRYKYLTSRIIRFVAVTAYFVPAVVLAHGAKIDYKVVPAITLQAMYDGGEPMAKAQIIVYAPDNPAEPWRTGSTDEQGYFTFSPDQSIVGEWAVQARQAGHGAMMHVNIGDENASGAASTTAATVTSAAAAQVQTTGPTPMQRWMMAASVIWGFIGTGLFFSRKRNS